MQLVDSIKNIEYHQLYILSVAGWADCALYVSQRHKQLVNPAKLSNTFRLFWIMTDREAERGGLLSFGDSQKWII